MQRVVRQVVAEARQSLEAAAAHESLDADRPAVAVAVAESRVAARAGQMLAAAAGGTWCLRLIARSVAVNHRQSKLPCS